MNSFVKIFETPPTPFYSLKKSLHENRLRDSPSYFYVYKLHHIIYIFQVISLKEYFNLSHPLLLLCLKKTSLHENNARDFLSNLYLYLILILSLCGIKPSTPTGFVVNIFIMLHVPSKTEWQLMIDFSFIRNRLPENTPVKFRRKHMEGFCTCCIPTLILMKKL